MGAQAWGRWTITPCVLGQSLLACPMAVMFCRQVPISLHRESAAPSWVQAAAAVEVASSAEFSAR